MPPLTHPALVHVPLGLAVVMPFVAAALTVAVLRGRLPRSALALVAALQLVVAGAGFAAMRLGHADAKVARQVVSDELIEDHEDVAETFVWTAVGVLVVAGAALVVPARLAPALGALATAGALAVAVLGVVAGHEGGQLVFQHGAGVARLGAPGAAAGGAGGEARAHDDD